MSSATNITVSNNTLTGTTSAGAYAYALGLIGTTTTATVTGNTLNASGGSTGNYFTFLNATTLTINSGSTGNVKGSGTCSSAGAITGSISYTDGSTCP